MERSAHRGAGSVSRGGAGTLGELPKGWIGVSTGTAFILGVLGAVSQWMAAPRELGIALSGFLLWFVPTCAAWPLVWVAAERWDRRVQLSNWSAPLAHLLPALTLSALHFLGSAALFRLVLSPPAGLSHRPLLDGLVPGMALRLMLYLYGVLAVRYLRGRARLERAEREAAQANRARLDRLRAQLDPHFVFNVLNGVHALVDVDAERARTMVRTVAELLRDGLEEGRDLVPLEDEITRLRRYVDLQRTRFPHRLVVEIDAAPEFGRRLVPYLMVQPLVENAIEHGMPDTGVLTVRVGISESAAGFVTTVADDGRGISSRGPNRREGRRGLGLANLRDRLRLLYGDSALVDLSQNGAGGAVARVTLPHEPPEAQA